MNPLALYAHLLATAAQWYRSRYLAPSVRQRQRDANDARESAEAASRWLAIYDGYLRRVQRYARPIVADLWDAPAGATEAGDAHPPRAACHGSHCERARCPADNVPQQNDMYSVRGDCGFLHYSVEEAEECKDIRSRKQADPTGGAPGSPAEAAINGKGGDA